MPRVRSGYAKKWVERASVATDAYREGVKNPRVNWAAATAAAEDSWKAGVQKAISDKRFGKGVQKAGDSKWQQGALTRGADRFASGVAASEQNYANQMAKVVAVIESANLPLKFERGNEQNYARAKAMGMALHQAKKDGKFL